MKETSRKRWFVKRKKGKKEEKEKGKKENGLYTAADGKGNKRKKGKRKKKENGCRGEETRCKLPFVKRKKRKKGKKRKMENRGAGALQPAWRAGGWPEFLIMSTQRHGWLPPSQDF